MALLSDFVPPTAAVPYASPGAMPMSGGGVSARGSYSGSASGAVSGGGAALAFIAAFIALALVYHLL